jgi:hypothetical protein
MDLSLWVTDEGLGAMLKINNGHIPVQFSKAIKINANY